MNVDEVRHHLFLSRGERVEVLDLPSGKVIGEISGTWVYTALHLPKTLNWVLQAMVMTIPLLCLIWIPLRPSR